MSERLLVSIFYEKTETMHLTVALSASQRETLESGGADLNDPRSIFDHLISDTEHGGPQFAEANSRTQTALTRFQFRGGAVTWP